METLNTRIRKMQRTILSIRLQLDDLEAELNRVGGAPTEGPIHDKVREIAVHAARIWDVPLAKVLGTTRQLEASRVRYAVCAAAVAHMGCDHAHIAAVIGRERSAVGYGLRRWGALVIVDREFSNNYAVLRAAIV